MKQWTLAEAISEAQGAIAGGIVPDQAGCIKFAEWKKWAPWVAEVGYHLLVNYGLADNLNIVEDSHFHNESMEIKEEP